ncbi:decarboxylase [Candidatus Woesearchaeota archaeon]|nr:decarboxylase [Candidatus Woesearchaeota archaeon]MBT6518703.1 decarboxylase [Candidatus Woesearchaeota archaeon]MBT7368375.1 decarboxylase [Candidatus Woesearchaeota archaeon]
MSDGKINNCCRTPRFELSKSKILEQFQKVKEVCKLVSYSSKTNSLASPILERETDCMFSVHLKNELKNISDLSRVIFLAQGWNLDEISEFIGLGITHFVVDNVVDLEIFEKYLEENENVCGLTLFLRLKLKERSLRTERYFVFGIESEIINKKIKKLSLFKESGKLTGLGIHFHRKTQNMSEWNLKYELEQTIEPEVFDLLDYVNIGGGLPSEYANTNVDVIKSVFSKVLDLGNWFESLGIKMIVEPGRFICAPAGRLFTKVLRIYNKNIIVNVSVYNTDMDALIVPVKLLIEGEVSKEKGEGEAYVIKGTTPCSMDLFRYRVYLKNICEGDELVFINAGAYNFSTDFCDLEKIETVIVD